jgi:phage gpG-like protein
MAQNEVRIHMSMHAEGFFHYTAEMKDRLQNMRPVFEVAKAKLEMHNAENFASNGLPVGGWKPLDAQYASWKAVHFPGTPPMVRTGKLLESVTNLSNSAVNIIGDMSATFGTDVEYAKFHQYGTAKMAKRKVIFTPEGFAHDIGKKAVDYAVNGISGLL